MPAKLTTETFIARSVSKHGNKYDYSKSHYWNNEAPIEITCPTHGSFMQRASNHMIGIGCPKCKTDKTVARCTDTSESFIKKAREVHGYAYDYSKIVYTRSNKKIEIICHIHGAFFQRPDAHINNKSGCPKCAGKNLTNDEFIEKLVDTHGDKYGYDKVKYNGIKNGIIVTCKIHGDFTQTAESHSIGRGCRQCWYESYASQSESEIRNFLNSHGIESIANDRDALNGFEIDIFVPSKNIGIEFNGRYWHSDKVEKNHKKHEFKHIAAQRKGIRIITIWDFDWATKRHIVECMLLNAIGCQDTEKIHARTCEIKQVSGSMANAFYEENHIQGGVRSSVLNIALLHDDNIVAAMSFTKGGTRRGKINDGEWELARYASSKNVRGGASRLFSEFKRTTSPKIVWSFSDNQHFSGGLYPILGFVEDGRLPADYRLIHRNKDIVWHKSLWQRKSIPKRLNEMNIDDTFDPKTDPRTEKQMHDVAGVLRIWDAGKTRWVFKPTNSQQI